MSNYKESHDEITQASAMPGPARFQLEQSMLSSLGSAYESWWDLSVPSTKEFLQQLGMVNIRTVWVVGP